MVAKLLVLGGVVAFFTAVLRAHSKERRTGQRTTVLHVLPAPLLYGLAAWALLGVPYRLLRPAGVEWGAACINGLLGIAVLWFARRRAREEPGASEL